MIYLYEETRSTNDLALESESLRNNNHMVRPYYQDGSVVRRFPHRSLIVRYSALARFISLHLTPLIRPHLPPEWTWASRPGSIEDYFDSEPGLLDDSIETTERIMAMVRDRAGERPVVAFSVDRPPVEGVYSRIAREKGIRFVEGVPDTIAAARARGEEVDFRPYDAHWTSRGHAIAAEVILRHLVETGILPAERPSGGALESGPRSSRQR